MQDNEIPFPANAVLTLAGKSCWHCGYTHDGVCPRVKSIEYYQDGTVKRVEYRDPAPGHAGVWLVPPPEPVCETAN